MVEEDVERRGVEREERERSGATSSGDPTARLDKEEYIYH